MKLSSLDKGFRELRVRIAGYDNQEVHLIVDVCVIQLYVSPTCMSGVFYTT